MAEFKKHQFTLNFMYSIDPGSSVLNKFCSSITLLCCNKALSLDVLSHMAIVNQMLC